MKGGRGYGQPRKAKVFLTPHIEAPPPTPEELAAARALAVEYARNRVIANAQQAVVTMENFLRTAKQRIADVAANPTAKDFTGDFRFLALPEEMLHEFAWGFANASSSIQSAMSATLDYLRLEKEPVS